MLKKMTLFFCGLFLYSFSLSAQENDTTEISKIYYLPSITVSTNRAIASKSPVPFSVITESEISKSYIYQDLPAMLSTLPSIYSYSQNGNSIGYSILSLRGFDQRRVSVLINGIPQNDPEDHDVYWIDVPDLSSNLGLIEVQRGGGLTSYGPPSIGGTINLSTTNFVNQRGLKLFAGGGFQEFGGKSKEISQNISKFSIEASSGFIDGYAFYARLSHINSFGYRDQSWVKMNSYFLSAARFDENSTTQINVFGGPISDGLSYTGIPKQYITDKEKRLVNYNYWEYDSTGKNVAYFQQRRPQEEEAFSQPHYEMLNDINISDKLQLLSSLFFYSGDGYFDYDATGWTDAQMFQLTPENGYPNAIDPRNPIIRAFVGNKQGGWIPRLLWKHKNGELLTGMEMRLHRSEHWGKIQYAENLPTNYNPDFKFYQFDGVRNIFSIFARENYNFTDKFSLNLEGQLIYNLYAIENEKLGNFYTQYKTIDGGLTGNGNEIFKVDYLFFNPKMGVNYLFNNSMNAYFLLTYTTREPNMSALYNASESFLGTLPNFEKQLDENGNPLYNFNNPLTKPEKMLDLELGYNFRTDLLDFNANFYWMQYSDELVKSGQLDIFGLPVMGNAPKTQHIGLELVFSADIIKSNYGNLNFSVNATFSRNRIIDYNYYIDNQNYISLKDNPIAGFPDILANFALTYSINNFFISFSSQYVGESRTDNFGDLLTQNQLLKESMGSGYYADNILDPYFIANLDISYTFENIFGLKSLTLQGKVNNLFNKLYAGGGQGKEFFPGAERNGFLGIEIGL